MEFEEFEKEMAAFQHKMLLNARSVILHLANEDIPIKDFLSYMEQRMKVEDARAIKFKQAPPIPCPECGKLMALLPVNRTPGTQTGDPDDKSVWMCPNKICMNAIYNKQTIEEIIKSGGT